MKNIFGWVLILFLLTGGAALAKDLPVDIQAEVIPEDMSASELDTWLSQNKENFDFYVEGRSIAEYRKDTQRKILAARKEAKQKVARIEKRLYEQMTGTRLKDKELIASAVKKKKRVYKEEMTKEEQLLNRQLRREVNIMRKKKFEETRIATLQREFREHIAVLKKKPAERIAAVAASLPAIDPELAQESEGKSKIKIDKKRRITVEHKPYGGEMSDRAKRRLQSR